jgi:hypothetical protein
LLREKPEKALMKTKKGRFFRRKYRPERIARKDRVMERLNGKS